jgi:hypothetical protein
MKDAAMRSLADLQGTFARALTAGAAATPFAAELVGGADSAARFAIHQRHYESSLTDALRTKFPACAWLAGADVVAAAARAYARRYPPSRPCIAEYGREFPGFLAAFGRGLPYLESFAELEWAVGQASIAVERTPCSWTEVSRLDPERLVDSRLVLQPGLHYLASSWRIDELMTTYLGGSEPERFELVESNTWVEVRGARGEVGVSRLEPSVFEFRTALAAGIPLGEAASRALDTDASFDAGAALRTLADTRLITEVAAVGLETPG